MDLFQKYSLLAAILFIPCFSFAQLAVDFNPIPASFNIESPNPTYALDVNYDVIDMERQAFHLFLPDTTASYPLVIFIHGGGFTGGSRNGTISSPNGMANIKYFLDRGIAYASIGYRLIPTNEEEEEGVIKCLMDSKRALQTIRYYADQLYIDPDKIVLTGSSAGAGTSLWLATRDDMAEPDASDPVLQMSTRVCAAGLSASQATYDIYKWETEVYQNFDGQGTNFTLDSMEALLSFDRLSNFYGGLDSLYQIVVDPAFIQYREEVDMLFHMSADDPPLYFVNNSGAVHPSQDLFHHSFQGQTIYNHALAAGIEEVKASIPALDLNTTEGESMNEFIERQLSACSATTSTEFTAPLLENELIVYPNPASTQVWVNATIQPIQSLKLYSMTGRLMLSKSRLNAYSTSLNTSNLPKGMYVLSIVDSAGQHKLERLIIN
ncbi:MAG: T9SS type A sorting domain-containing protein [Bacteroidota bacterium]